MGLKQDLIDAKVKAAQEVGMTELETGDGSFIERDAEYTKEAIVDFLTSCEFRVTQLNAPVILEKLKTPAQPVDIKLETLLGDKQPIFKSFESLGSIPGAGSIVKKLVSKLKAEIKKAVSNLVKGGATLPGLDLGKDNNALDSAGYVFIGEDPDSQDGFDVSDEDGQREFTTVKLIREDIEELL